MTQHAWLKMEPRLTTLCAGFVRKNSSSFHRMVSRPPLHMSQSLSTKTFSPTSSIRRPFSPPDRDLQKDDVYHCEDPRRAEVPLLPPPHREAREYSKLQVDRLDYQGNLLQAKVKGPIPTQRRVLKDDKGMLICSLAQGNL